MLNKIRTKKQTTLILSIAAVLIIGVGGVIAFIVTNTGLINNMFNPTQVSCEVNETLDGNTKKEVKVENTSNIPVFIRAEIVVTWKNKAGEVLGEPVGEGNYTLKLKEGTKWVKGPDEYYYYKVPVNALDSTEVLIESCTQNVDCEQEGYFLNVEIVASAIQASGVDVVNDKAVKAAWGIDPTTL